METKKLKIKISGIVQGVFFRAETREKAVVLGLAGSVRNVNDGTVEIIAEGNTEKLEELLEWSRKGPELAKVEKIESVWEKPSGNFTSFNIE